MSCAVTAENLKSMILKSWMQKATYFINPFPQLLEKQSYRKRNQSALPEAGGEEELNDREEGGIWKYF